MKTIDDMDFSGKKVIIRAEYDVPVEDGKVTDDTRIRKSLPTIRRILEKGARQIVLMAHMGRPKGQVVEGLRLNPIGDSLRELLGEEVVKLDDCINIQIPENKIVLLENLRFHKEEEEDYEFFAKQLASYADIYVNECFSVSHRKHASLHRITEFLPSCAGLQLKKELDYLQDGLKEPERPFVAIIGGAKVSDKIILMDRLLKKVDKLLIGGAMIFTFYKAKGYEVGKSLYEPERVDLARLMLNNDKIVLPTDIVIAADKQPGLEKQTVPPQKIPVEMIGLDIGPESVAGFKKHLQRARTVVWNGPMGLFEIDDFAAGTEGIARALAGMDCLKIVGGGDSSAAIKKLSLEDAFTHISTGGGASLALLEGKVLPAVQALEDNATRYS